MYSKKYSRSPRGTPETSQLENQNSPKRHYSKKFGYDNEGLKAKWADKGTPNQRETSSKESQGNALSKLFEIEKDIPNQPKEEQNLNNNKKHRCSICMCIPK